MTTAMLWKEYKKSKSSRLKEALIKQYLRLVYYVIHRTDLKGAHLLNDQDFYQFGILGLNEAIERFDPNYGVKFETYAIPRIRGMILDELRKLDFIPRSYKENVKRELDEENARRRENDQCELTITDYLREYQKLSLSQQVGEEEDTILDLLPGDQETPIDIVEKENIKEIILQELNRLPERQKLVITLYYFEEMNYQEIADLMNISVSRVSQLHTEVINRLRKKLKKILR
ncbi:MAG: sigma-70 family RNA polymerase sigma factor [Ignavibacteria bacterium]|jgi:RNA polymerase sigma factor for flagellar operon FliA|nr:sigma-70 family RNA polymerase sigma factor [Ignavibacteria bacterium]MDH7526783.1 sigma-70 family RNA polymerase sigma factor [Ignavibacteria bacterium]